MRGYRRGLGPGATDPDGGVARELDEEIRAHLDMRTAELVARGMSPEDARAEALRRFGEGHRTRRRLLAGVRRARRHRRLRRALETVVSDVRLAARGARRSPGFAAVAVLVFAAGVGLTTSMVAVADHVLLRPLPHPEPGQLVALWSKAERGSGFRWVSMGNWVDWKGAESIGSTAIHAVHRASVATDEDAFHAATARVAGPFFATLGNTLLTGRAFTEAEAQAGAPVAVVSEGFWRRVLGSGPPPLADLLEVNGRAVQVVGVVRQGEAFPAGTEIWIPFPYRAEGGALRNNINYEAMARLRSDATLEQARAELGAIAARIRASDPEARYSWGVGVRPLRDVVVGDARPYLVLLTVAVGLLLLAACANLAGLSLARARRRVRESAVHLALGAGRARLVRRTVTEHVLLAAVGGGLGVALAWLSTEALMSRVASVVPRADEVAFDVRVALLGGAAALGAGLLAGLLPALRGSRGDLSTVLSGARGGITGGRGLPGAAMVGAEIALAVTLLVTGALLIRSFQGLVSRDLGFEPTGVVTAEIALVGPAYADPERRLLFWTSLTERVGELPGIEEVAVSNAIPTSDAGRGFIDLPGREGDDIGAGYRVVSDRYFDALGVPLLAGRHFEASDGPDTERVTIVSRSMVERFWPGGDPLGQRVRARSMEAMIGGGAPWLTVVGVVGDMRQYGWESQPEAEMYVLHRQVPHFTQGMTLVARGRGGVTGWESALRAAVRELDPSLAVELASLDALLARLTEERRLVLAGLGLFGGAALLLVCLGIYGLMSFAAGERAPEMAVRVALGAPRGGIVGLMLGSALRVVLVGAAVGLVAARGFTRLLDGLLVEVGAADPFSYAAALAVLATVALAAALVPSLRAARRDPLDALRDEG
ncbi:MAG TPA: ADOP family duplicated permease [Longimicrobiales bacterium]|nr:ADOP family duplicated permease [Longimicrobiales bacterium]